VLASSVLTVMGDGRMPRVVDATVRNEAYNALDLFHCLISSYFNTSLVQPHDGKAIVW
jgi:hypothetical protein